MTERRTWILTAAALAAVLVPVVLSPVLPTQDGPSHLYNAFLAHRLEGGDPLFGPFLELGPGLWPNRFTHYVLTGLGPLLGWSAAERVVAILAAGLPLLALVPWLRSRIGAAPGFVLAAGLWTAGSWFFWKGFYDFSVSLAPFLGAALVVGRMDRSPGWRSHMALQAMLALSLVAHLFTFAVTLALVAFVLAWRWWRGETASRHLAAVAPGAAALALVMGGGATGGGGMSWYPWAQALEGLFSADWAAAVLEADRWAGRAVTVALVSAPLLRFGLMGNGRGDAAGGGPKGAADRADRSLPTPFEIFALLAFVGSVALPARVGTGQYAPERLRLLALLLLTPSAAGVAVHLRARGSRLLGWIAPAAGLALAAVFLFRGLETARYANRLDDDLRSMDRALEAHGAPAGTWITATHWNPFGPFYRIGAWIHVHDRLAVERELMVLDNYEARMPIFPVGWREIPHRPAFHRVQAGQSLAWLVEITSGARPWEDPLLVLHEARYPLVTRSDRLRVGSATALAGHAVTELRRSTGRAERERPRQGVLRADATASGPPTSACGSPAGRRPPSGP